MYKPPPRFQDGRRPAYGSTPPRRSGSRDAAPPPAPPASPESPWAQLRGFTHHPIVYQRMVAAADPSARAGDIVAVYDRAGDFHGRAIYHPKAPIALRMLSRAPAPIDDAFWRTALQRAIGLRRRLDLNAATNAYRLIHAEGDGLSGLIAERYADCLVFEIFALGIHQRIGMIADQLQRLLASPDDGGATAAPLQVPPTGPEPANPGFRVVIRADDRIQSLEGFSVPSTDPKSVGRLIVHEHGIRYRVDPAAGHKTGFFCDQRENRRRFAEFCGGAKVLDVCCYNAGFSLCAKILGHAEDVTAVDLDEAALAIARENVNLNNARVHLVHSDAFTYLRQLVTNRRQFDAVVVDPSKFVASRDDIKLGLRKYHDLNYLAIQLVAPGGILLTCSCSGLVDTETFADTLQRAGRNAGRTLQLFARTAAAPDHPVILDCPESAYLKAFWLRVL